MQIEIDRHTEKLLKALGATDAAAREAMVREALEAKLEARRREETPLTREERKILTEKLDKILAQAMAGDSRELTDADWQDIVAGRYKHPFDPDSLAVPPGWKPKKKQG